MGNKAKDDDLYQEMCRVVGKVVLEMRDLGQEPKHIVIAGVLRTSLANRKIQRSPLTVEAMEKVIHALFRALIPYAGGSGNHEADHRPDGNVTMVSHHRFIVDGG
ncbi:Protein of uncharacterised function (DUF2767) [Klebsiella pneumoniae subsp. ozaenae]|uniref:Fumarase D n=4 Tax=Enterobacteriaceae TaxID=543 RepID=A0A378BC95_KLEPO|nr:Protein of uncharacterised function (DUF2767) [Klebsiella pneumoniae subsp. ozaenae]